MRSAVTWSVRMFRGLGLWVLGILYKLMYARPFAFPPINSPLPYSLLSSPTIPTSDIMSSFNAVHPSLYVSTTPVDQESAIPNAWNQMRAHVRPMMLEVSGVFQQSLLIVS